MKKFLLFFIVNCSLFIVNCSAQGVYIEYKITAGDGKETMSGNSKTYSQDGNSRSEMQFSVPGLPMGAMNTITLIRKDKPNMVTTLNTQNKTYTEMSFEEYKKDENKSDEEFEVTLVGKETVNGYSCTHVIAKYKKSGKVRNDWWTSKDVPGFNGFKGVKGSKYLDDDSFYGKLAEKGADGFPVRMKMSETGGAGSFQMDLVKAEKKNNPASLFEIPAGYTKAATVDLSKMPKNMQDMQNMTPEEQKKMMEELMKMYGGQMPAEKQ